MNLSPEQSQIVEAPDGHYLVVASAGSGKTRVLTERVRHLLEVRKIRSRILMLTFTNKAAEEMRQRLETLPDLQDRAFIGTIHCFCQSILESHGRAIGYESMPAILEREADRLALLEQAFDQNPELRRHLLRQEGPKERRQFLYGVLEKISSCKRDWNQYQQIASGEWPSQRESQAFREYQDHLASQGVIDFDDILLLALRILTERPAIADIYQRTYRYLCVDEAQDLNAVQYALIKTLGAGATSILMVGDPNQAIYGFNGSNHRFMMEDFSKDFEVVHRELRQNYRSSKAVIRVANALYPDSNEVNQAALDGEAMVIKCPEEMAEAQWITAKIQELVKVGTHPDIEGAITLQRMVILARNRFVFAPLQEQLEAAGIDYHMRQAGGGVSFESEAGKILDLAVRLAINPLNRLLFNQLCRFLAISVDEPDGEIDGLAILKATFGQASSEWRSWVDPLVPFIGSLHVDINCFSVAVGKLEADWQHASASLAEEQEAGEQALGDLRYLKEIWRNYAANVARENRSLTQFRNQMSTGEILPHMTGKGLMLAPVHTVKGLEFEIVFLMGMVEGTFPDYRAVKSDGPALIEEKNDAFVAITRAKRILYLTWSEEKFMPWDRDRRVRQRRSRYLDDIERLIPEASHGCTNFRVAEDSPSYRVPPLE
jgi:DNA helicase II / ATP-dependent DNA helicase PcrA